MKYSAQKMDRTSMLSMLSALDGELNRPLRIAVTGSSALILRNVIIRQSGDIDILQASEDINSPDLSQRINRVSDRFSLPRAWLNDDAKKTLALLPKGYSFELTRIEGDFKYLEPYVISTADSIISKLVLFDNIRPWDVRDIKSLNLTQQDIDAVSSRLASISRTDPELSLNIEVAFKRIRPDLVKTKDGFSYSSVAEAAEYAKTRYAIDISREQAEIWEVAIDNLETTFPKIIAEIDSMMLEKHKHKDGHDAHKI